MSSPALPRRMPALPRVVIAACLFACVEATAHAAPAGPVTLVDREIPSRDAESADADFRKECDWNATMPSYLVRQSKGRVLAAGEGPSNPTLKLVTQTLHTAGGGMWSGPKWLVVEGTLAEGGNVLGTFEARRQTIRGSLSGCTTVRELGEAIADDIVEWLAAPTRDAKLGDAK